MNCPMCGTENTEDAVTCTKCGAALVEDADVELVTVLETGDVASLEVAKSLLEAEGIPCETQGESIVGFGPNPGSMGTLKLMVASEDEEAARELLAQQENTPATDE